MILRKKQKIYIEHKLFTYFLHKKLSKLKQKWKIDIKHKLFTYIIFQKTYVNWSKCASFE